ncbi:hypothetical protein BJL95_13460 [Methylomonas sp. LWB]|uniref:lipopolysaccharide biosynthesis protein n=1 Tax=Methylomonas sp. LWB TaxID=1905845 RepID=UPI000913518E|nr:lipopolysaccharide biosynthesis protein [Methylomonas sp. LWB]OHX37575.1 hypothetical protein BJL95_13460 [Methylomonas sp. LWB]
MTKIKKLSSGVAWGTLSTVFVTAFQLIFMAVMARLLDPSAFGVVAVANVCLRFFSFFAQIGTAPAIIQKRDLNEGDVPAALAISLGISATFCVLVQVAAPVFELFYEMPGLASVIRVLSINFVISGFAAVAQGLLQRNTAFRSIAIIDVVAYLIGYGIVGITAAYSGLEVWALVCAVMTQLTVTAALSYMAMPFPLSLKHSPAQRRHFLSYGGRYSVIGFMEFLAASLDALVVGKLLGAKISGYYSRANLLANLPVQQPANILTKALFPIVSSIGNQREKQKYSLQLSILLVGSYAFSVSLTIYLTANDIVKVLLGENWLEAIPILQMLSLSVGPSFISHVAGVTLNSMNKLRVKMQVQFFALVLISFLLFVLAPSGDVVDIALALVITEWVRLIVVTIKLSRILRISVKETLLAGVCIVTMATLTIVTVYASIQFIPENIPKIFRLAIDGLSAIIGFGLGLMVSRYVAFRLPAVKYLLKQSAMLKKFFPKRYFL